MRQSRRLVQSETLRMWMCEKQLGEAIEGQRVNIARMRVKQERLNKRIWKLKIALLEGIQDDMDESEDNAGTSSPAEGVDELDAEPTVPEPFDEADPQSMECGAGESSEQPR